ncbi:FAD-dependent oxidoreductase [Pseudonocardia sp. CA-107938]|uniref:FAD-dependent oxidoreductase n=1 Tax=Pseudonocardia sp. CA-107938 TaxID=3240021 RepID=UPI003D9400DC
MKIAVVGGGVVGMSATVALLDAGHDVTCYEPGPIMGERSVGSTRIFRFAHVEPELVRLAGEARRGFDRWSELAGRPMVLPVECVITGSDLVERASAMAEVGADFEVVRAGSGRLRLPVREEPAVALVDVGGGVVDVDAVRAFLTERGGRAVVHEPVYRLDVTAGGAVAVTAPGGRTEFDALLLAAGAATAHLAAQVGIHVPPLLAHHLRCTFPVADGEWQAWIDLPRDRPGTYQHLAGPGRWAVGSAVEAAEVAWERGRDAAEAASRTALLEYARTHLAVDPTIVDEIYCTTVPNLDDGVHVRRNGPVVANYGVNLMKFAPVLGRDLAAAVST